MSFPSSPTNGQTIIANGITYSYSTSTNSWTRAASGASLVATAVTSTNISGGTPGSIPYQTAAGATGFIPIGGFNTALISDGSTATWSSLSGISAGASTNADNIQVSTLTPGDRYFTLADVVDGSYVGLESTTINKFNAGTGVTIGSTATFTLNTQATSTATGALKVIGGVGIGGNLYVGGEIVAQKLTIEYTTVTTTLVKTDDVIQTTNNTAASSTTTGAVIVTGGVGIGGGGYFGSSVTAPSFIGNIASSYITSTSTLQVGYAANLLGNGAGNGSLLYQSAANTTGFLGQGSAGWLLVSAGAGSAPAFTSTGSIYVNSAVNANNIIGGAANQIHYQSAVGVTAFSSNLTFNGTTLTANTLNLTNALGTSYGGTGLTSFTSGGVVYASSTSALATGSALTFDGTNLGVGTASPVNKLVVSNAGAAGFEVNPADASGVALASYNRSGAAYANSIYYASNQIFCAGGTTEGMRLTSTGLGIGTSSTSYRLQVANGTFQSVGTSLISVTDVAHVYRGTPDGTGYEHAKVYSGRDATVYTYGSYLSFYTEGKNSGTTDTSTEKMRLDPSGKLGIGTTGPTSTVDVFGLQTNSGSTSAATPTGTLRLAYAGGPAAGNYGSSMVFSQQWYSSATNQVSVGQITGVKNAGDGNFGGGLAFFYGPFGANALAEGMRLEYTGNVGIGTTSPNLLGSNRALTLNAAIGNVTTEYAVAGTTQAYISADTTKFLLSAYQSIPMLFNTGNTERARLDTSGNLLVNTTTTLSGAKFAVNGPAYVNSTGTFTGALVVGTAAAGVPGEIRATNEITAYYSDRRLKENVQIIDNAVVKVLSLTGITYTPNALAESYGYDRTKKLAGLFADEVAAVLPEAVRPAPFDDAGAGVSKSGEHYQTIQYEKLIPLLVEAIKEQQQRIIQLNEAINSLTSKE